MLPASSLESSTSEILPPSSRSSPPEGAEATSLSPSSMPEISSEPSPSSRPLLPDAARLALSARLPLPSPSSRSPRSRSSVLPLAAGGGVASSPPAAPEAIIESSSSLPPPSKESPPLRARSSASSMASACRSPPAFTPEASSSSRPSSARGSSRSRSTERPSSAPAVCSHDAASPLSCFRCSISSPRNFSEPPSRIGKSSFRSTSFCTSSAEIPSAAAASSRVRNFPAMSATL